MGNFGAQTADAALTAGGLILGVAGDWSAICPYSGSNVQPANNTEYAIPFLCPRDGTIDQLGAFLVTVGSTNATTRFGLRAHNAATARPSTAAPLADTGAIAATSGASALLSGTITPAVVVTAGTVYWFSFTNQGSPSPNLPTYKQIVGTTPQIPLNLGGSAGSGLGALLQGSVSGALPSAFTIASSATPGGTPYCAIHWSA